MQDCCTPTYMAMWFAPSLTLSSTLGIFLMLSLPYPLTPCYPSPSPPSTDRPWVWYSPPCIHVFSLFNICLWVRTCSVWFSVLVSVCWEWWFPVSSMSLQRTQTHRFWWLHSIPWCICATFSLSSLSLIGIWVGSRSLLLWTVLQWTYVCLCLYNRMIIILWVYTQ